MHRILSFEEIKIVDDYGES